MIGDGHRLEIAIMAIMVVGAAFGTSTVAVAESTSTDSCQEINGHKYCVTSVSTTQDTVAPGETVTVTATVENRGSKEGSISTFLGLRGPDGDRWYPSGQKAYDIPLDGEVTIEYTADIPEDASEGPYELTVDVWTGNDAQMFHTSGWLQQFDVEEPTTSAEIASTAASGTYEPGDRVPVEVTVENTGDTTHDFYVDASLQRPNGNWITGEGTTVSLRPGAQQTVTLDVQVPDDASEGTYSAGSGVFHTSAKDERYDYGNDPDAVTVEQPNSAPSAERDSPSSSVTIQRGESVQFEIDATDSDGNLVGTEWYVDDSLVDESQWIDGSSDTATISRTFDEAGTYTVEGTVFDSERAYSDAVEWTVTVEQSNSAPRADRNSPSSAVTIQRGESVQFEIDATDSDGNLVGTEWYVDDSLVDESQWIDGSSDTATISRTFDEAGTYTVEGTVFDSERAYSDAVEWTVTVEEPTTDAAITRTAADGTYQPGDRVPVEVTVENTGDTTHDFYVDASLQRPNGDWITGEGATVGLRPGAQQTVTLDVQIPDDASEGSYSAGSGVFHASAKDDQYDAGSDPDAVTVEQPNSAPNAERTEPSSSITIQRGESVQFEIDATDSDGNLVGTEWYVDDSLVDESQWIDGSSDTATVSRTFDEAGTYTVEGTVFDSERAYSDAVEWTVTVEEPTTDAGISATETRGSYNPGDRVPVEVTVENTGDTTHDFYVDASLQRPNGGWITGEGTTVSLRPGAQQTVTLDVQVPDDASEGSYSAGSGVFHTSAKETRYGTGHDSDAVSVVPDNTAPSATRASPERETTVTTGESVQFEIDATDSDGNLAGTEWYVDDSLVDESRWIGGSSDTATVSRTFDEAGTYTVEATVFDSERAYSDAVAWTVTVEEPSTDAEIVQTDADGRYTAGASVPVEVTVENTGETTHEFSVDASLQRPDGDWYTGSEATPRLSPGETRTVRLSVQLPEDAPGGSYAAGSAVYHTSDEETVHARDATDRTIAVEQPTTDAAVVGVTSDGTAFAPGDEVPVDVTVENTGDLAHDFSVDASLQTPDGDWFTGRDTAVDIRPGARKTVTLDVQVPDDAAGGQYSVGAGVRPNADGDLLDSATSSDDIVVKQRIDASVTVAPVRTGPFVPGETVPVEVTVENTGEASHEFYADASLQRPDGSWIAGEGEPVSLRPGAQRTVALDVALPDSASPGSYTAGAGVFSGREVEQSYDTARGSQSVAVEARNTTVTIDDGRVVGEAFDPGDRVPVEVTVSNEGNTATTAYVDASLQRPNGDWITGEGRTVEVAPGEDRQLDLAVEVPTTANGGTYAAATAAYQSRQKDERKAQSTVAEAVPVTSSAAATIVDSTFPSGAYQSGEAATTDLVVRNDGPVENTFYVGYTVVGPDGNQYDADGSTGRTVTVAPGEREPVTVSWNVPGDAPPGQYDAVATVWNETDRENLETTLATVTDEEAFGVSTGGLSVLAVDSERPAYEPGDLAIVETTLANNGTTTTEYEVVGAFTHLAASDPTVEPTQTVTLRPGERATLAFEWTTSPENRSGDYDTTILVREAATDETVGERTVPSAFTLRKPNEVVQIDGVRVGPGPYQPKDELSLTTRVTSSDDEDRLVAVDYEVRVDGEWREFHTVQTVLEPERTVALEHAPRVPDYLDAGSYDLRVSVRGTDSETYLYARTATERALRVASESALVVEVRDRSGAPLSAGHVSVDREGTYPKIVGDDGTVRFTDLESGDLSIVAYPADHPRQTRTIEYENGTTRRVTFTFGESASVAGSLSLSDGTALRNVVVEIDGNTARTGEDGYFEFDEPLATGSTTAVFRVDGDRIGKRPVYIDQRTDSYDFRLQDRNPTDPPSSFARGALCGLGCSVENAEDPSQYTAGWIASGFVAAGDLRDLVVAIDTDQGGEAALAAFGLLPTLGDASSAAPKVAKLGDVASVAERLEFQRFLGRIDQFEDSRLWLANKLYDGTPTTYLDETLGMQKSSIEELMTGGRDLERISDSAKRLRNEYGFAKDRVRQYVKTGRNPEDLEDAAQSRRATDETVDSDIRVDGEALDDIAKTDDLAEVTASRRLADANSARIAGNIDDISDLEDGRYVIHAADTADVPAIRAGDIDSMVVSKNGDTVTIERVYEVFAGSNVNNAIEKKTQLNNRILPGLRQNADDLADDSLTVEVADNLDGTVYLPEETAAMEYPRAINEGDTVRDSIRRSGYDVRTFDRTSDQFEQDYKALADATDTTTSLRGPAGDASRLEVPGT